MTSGRPSLPDRLGVPRWLRALGWMVLSWAVPLALGGALMWSRSFVMEPDLARALTCGEGAPATALPCRVIDTERRLAAKVLDDEQDRRARRTVERATMKRLVSYDATDREDDRRLKASAASNARNAFAKQCEQYVTTGSCAGMSLEEAAQYALDAPGAPR